MATFMLVHGACTGGWCWEKVAPLLEANGHRVCAPDLPGLGKDHTPPANVTLADNVEKISRLLDKMEEPVVLVGHSLGGVTISQLAEARRRKIKALVYLCALLPTSGIYPAGHQGFDLVLRVKYMILPAAVVAIQVIAQYSRYMRASLLEVVNSDYMRTARSKGISEKRVIVRHALRNALIPVVTVAAIDIGAVVGGLIITEGIFEYRGMGLYLIRALNNGDFPELMPWLVIIVISTVLFNLLADVAYAWLDPRIRLD